MNQGPLYQASRDMKFRRPLSDCGRRRRLRLGPVVDFLLRLVLGVAVTLLQFAFQLLALAIDGGQIIVGEIAPTSP